jgi:hypothetical protein
MTAESCPCGCPLLDGACTHCDLTPDPAEELLRAIFTEPQCNCPPSTAAGLVLLCPVHDEPPFRDITRADIPEREDYLPPGRGRRSK